MGDGSKRPGEVEPASDTLAGLTVAHRPSALRAPPPPSTEEVSSSLPSAAPVREASFVEALRHAELERTRRFAPLTGLMGLLAAAALPFLGGDATARAIVWVAIAVALLAIFYIYRLTDDPDRYTDGRVGAAYGVCIVCLFAAVYFFGTFSAAVAVLTLGIFFVSIGRSRRVAAFLYLTTAGLQAIMVGLIIGGVLPDLGVMTAESMDVDQQIVTQGLVQVVFLVTYLVARATRTQLDHAVADHDGAIRQVAKRDALLEEARQELDRAMKIGGPGRYTGQTFGSFVLGAVIGRGGFGEVYEAAHRESGDPAAVKLLSMSALGQPGQLARFLREARAAASLSSPHVVAILEVGDADSPLPYLAMERLIGADLSTRLRQNQVFSVKMVVEMVQQVARGLEAAAVAGIVHRDIKPQNLFLTEDGPRQRARWKILDFGVSKLDSHGGTLTHGQLVGTPMYMAPEQAQGENVDRRADIYALAAVAYRMLTGQPPFPGKDLATIVYDVVYKMPLRPSDLAPLSPDVDRVMAIALAKRPADRFAEARHFAHALSQAVKGRLARPLRQRGDRLSQRHRWGDQVEI